MDDLLDSAGVAEVLNIKTETVRWYHKRGVLPPADGRFGRSPVWKKATIVDWDNKRKEITFEGLGETSALSDSTSN